ncbi:DUF1905 domain-containing protein [Micromonospora sp. NPDC049102]|uniref:DUF1905 domain-containing protein n=1 Tax=Micromonospora sp. NPDC049102 TaxID=3364265 RepID=UPI00371A9DC1
MVRQLLAAPSVDAGVARLSERERSRGRTSLFPKDEGHVLPLRDSVRDKEGIALDDVVHIRLAVRPR